MKGRKAIEHLAGMVAESAGMSPAISKWVGVRPGIVASTERGVSLATEYSYSSQCSPNLQNEELMQWMTVPRRFYVSLQLHF